MPYKLHKYLIFRMCNAAVGVKAFFDMMHEGPRKVMLFGAACTHVTDPIAKASKHWRLTQKEFIVGRLKVAYPLTLTFDVEFHNHNMGVTFI
ncbi:hypothetical protein J437_LFUL000737 [Ladona fulva]|uniref:Uncharacterized protein n=1 Tax=Ladona fulva TaxID=123851 RepID=A0A8K0NU94_LADFU|nr:hypothetical protein J437_LFUL000737 [Ladona fulva]